MNSYMFSLQVPVPLAAQGNPGAAHCGDRGCIRIIPHVVFISVFDGVQGAVEIEQQSFDADW